MVSTANLRHYTKVLKTSLNMILTGNPGTGKTTVARLLAKYLCAFGVLPHERFVEKNGLELKGQFVGQTAPVVKEAVADAMGGTLFVDEAYALVSRGGDHFSMETIRTLLTEVENNRTSMFVVLAGYKAEMDDLMASDPGLPRRFAQRLHLEDYTPREIAEICAKVAEERFEAELAEGTLNALERHVATEHSHDIAEHNGGLAVNLVEAAMRRMSARVVAEAAAAAADDRSGVGQVRQMTKLRQILTKEDFGIGTNASSASGEAVQVDIRLILG